MRPELGNDVACLACHKIAPSFAHIAVVRHLLGGICALWTKQLAAALELLRSHVNAVRLTADTSLMWPTSLPPLPLVHPM
jgi:hypothetical protein